MTTRHVHWLPGNKGTQSPNNVIWFDTETTQTKGDDGLDYHALWFGYACYQRRSKGLEWEGEQWYRFDGIDAFWDWVIAKTRSKTRLYLLCHNGSFDLPVLSAFTQLPARGYKLTNVAGDAPPLILTWRSGNRVIKFLDTLNWWRMPLQTIGTNIGLPKLPMPSPDAPDEEWERYGRRDVEIIKDVFQAWLAFIRTNDLGGFAPTLASQAMNAYRHRFMSHQILIDNNTQATELSRSSYLGARTECFQIGQFTGEYFYLDVNSMYPSVMLDGEFPRAIRGRYWRPSDNQVDEWLNECCVTALCRIKTEDPVYPVIHGGKLIFPVGEFMTHLATPELRHAVNHGHVTMVERIAVYDKAQLFHDYIKTIYGMRLDAQRQGDDVNAWLYKTMLNSLYGKFGQRGRFYTTIGECNPNLVEVDTEIIYETEEIRHIRRFGGLEQQLQIDGESRNSFPAIASHVTSYARLKLYNAIQTAGRENCYYCDTDSLIVNLRGFQRMEVFLDQRQLGKWKLENRISKMTIHGPKDYVLDTVTRTKGVRSNALWLAPNKIEQDQFMGLQGLLRLGSLNAPVSFKINKTLKRSYTKGIVNESGLVTPIRLTLDGQSCDD